MWLLLRPQVLLYVRGAPQHNSSYALSIQVRERLVSCSFTVTEVCGLAQGRRPYRAGLVGGMAGLIQLIYHEERSPKSVGAYLRPSSPVNAEMYKDGAGFFHGFS